MAAGQDVASGPSREHHRGVLFQFYRPVGVVEELFPGVVPLVAEVDVHERVVLGPDRLFD